MCFIENIIKFDCKFEFSFLNEEVSQKSVIVMTSNLAGLFEGPSRVTSPNVKQFGPSI
jgi:hypothetical protein